MKWFFGRGGASTPNRRVNHTAREFGRQIVRAFESGELETINYLLRPVVTAMRYGAGTVDDSDITFYFVSARFLSDAYHLLFDRVRSSFKENFFYIGGFPVPGAGKGRYVWDHPIQVDFSEQQAFGVCVDMASGAAALDHLREMGLSLVGHIHSHPGFGPEMSHPSETDARFVRTLAVGRSIALGAVFSRSAHDDNEAYVRFYAHRSLHPIQIVVEGTGARKLNENLFQIRVHPTPVAAQHHSHSTDDGSET